MSKLLLPRGYKPLLDELATECAIRKIKNQFQSDLAFELKLQRVTAPLFVLSGTGINDNLNGVEKPVSFGIKDIVTHGDFPIVWTNTKYRMVYLNMGHGDEAFIDATQNLLFVNAFRWVVSRDPKGDPFKK